MTSFHFMMTSVQKSPETKTRIVLFKVKHILTNKTFNSGRKIVVNVVAFNLGLFIANWVKSSPGRTDKVISTCPTSFLNVKKNYDEP